MDWTSDVDVCDFGLDQMEGAIERRGGRFLAQLARSRGEVDLRET